MLRQIFLLICICSAGVFAQMPPIEPGVSKSLAEWRAARYSDVRYKLNLTLEKMSPVLKGTMEIRVNVSAGTQAPSPANAGSSGVANIPIILDWRRIKGHEDKSVISNIVVNGVAVSPRGGDAGEGARVPVEEHNEHLIFRDGVKIGENVIKLDFTSPILASGSAITRYIDKEDGSEYIYSLFVPSDASTAFPVFDQPDLKARFTLKLSTPRDWKAVSNSIALSEKWEEHWEVDEKAPTKPNEAVLSNWWTIDFGYAQTQPISTYVFAFAAGPFVEFDGPDGATNSLTSTYRKWDPRDVTYFFPAKKNGTNVTASKSEPSLQGNKKNESTPPTNARGTDPTRISIYVRRSQLAKFQPHAAEVFRLNRESIKYFEEYFDYKFPFPKYDLVLIPEFPFGGMEHAGATFLRESAIIFPQEPTKSDHISRAVLIFHEAAHQWFGDTVTMKWFDDLWLKEGFANFMAYKAVDKIMPDANAWKVFYERIKQPAYATDSTRGTTPIYQPIDNLNSAKSAYGNIAYNKAPAFLKQAEFYLGPDKFQTAVRAFLKKHEFKNAKWEDLVSEFEWASGKEQLDHSQFTDDELRTIRQYDEAKGTNLRSWASRWVVDPGVLRIRLGKKWPNNKRQLYSYFYETNNEGNNECRPMKFGLLVRFDKEKSRLTSERTACDPQLYDPGKSYLEAVNGVVFDPKKNLGEPLLIFPNANDHGYGIFLLDDKSREYVLKNVQNEKDAFLRSMMYGALWDSVRESELDPRAYVEVAIKNLPTEQDETIAQMMLSRTATALGYYLSEPPAVAGGLSNGTTNSSGQSTLSSTSNLARDQPPGSGTENVPVLPRSATAAGGSDMRTRFENVLIDRMQNAETAGQRITYFRALVANATTERSRGVLKGLLKSEPPAVAGGLSRSSANTAETSNASVNPNSTNANLQPPATAGGSDRKVLTLRTKDKFDIVTRLAVLNDPDAAKLLAELGKTETSDDAKRYAYAARAAFPTKENREKFWNDFVNNKDISESWIEAAFVPFNAVRNSELSLPYLRRALEELPNHKRSRKIFFVNGWLAAFIGGQRSEEALAIVNKFLADNPNLDKDLRLKILENVDVIERAVRIRTKYK